ncbi:DNA-directed RNA polymerase III subunit 22.9 kDa, putative [Talaromyces stipitatus ATCC 10500]|uniref:DNA-directed RNA polymerase subunit n=1 Tax=Talaromyces stipitatus (strain ATCC 10500 / CBS 375.48 / QM 6759 / NRRL 1006) TaxID=441959 RepID=B8MDX8_TALSN|nr:DNA-directed RNA polymerase III subunit 22.9 kDa, putative [Talaromyces stipitatus ATCC 10500]EED16055.1 DNA-directed RNA polymerase III subunit 22.9 kDa, putative [Talaromyces stipitatus ATCC 10500]
MFILTTISDLVQIRPEDFSKFSAVAIEDNINEKYANKVVQNIGLCIGFYDLLKSSDGLIGHGTGLVNVNVTFRLIVFRPFKGEILLGKITGSSEEGLKIGMEFFSDITVPGDLLFDGSEYDIAENLWAWHYPDAPEPHWYDIGEVVRFRVEAEEWHDQRPTGPDRMEAQTVSESKPPYSLIASMAIDGLGRPAWW